MTEPTLFDEVREDLERQRLEGLWNQYGGWIVALAVTVVLATAIASGYRSWRADRDQHLTADLLRAEGAAPDQRLKALQDFAAAHPGRDEAAFARLRAGALAAQAHDLKTAAAQYHAVATDTKIDDAFRQLGTLLEVQAQVDTGDAAALSATLDPLTAENAPWQFSALETQGLLALRSGDKDRARQIFTRLTQDARVPHGISVRAADILRGID